MHPCRETLAHSAHRLAGKLAGNLRIAKNPCTTNVTARQRHDRYDNTRVTFTENKLPFEQPRHPPHGVLVNKDGGDKSHVAPHEYYAGLRTIAKKHELNSNWMDDPNEGAMTRDRLCPEAEPFPSRNEVSGELLKYAANKP